MYTKQILTYLSLTLTIILLTSCSTSETDNKPTVAVSVLPQQAFVEGVAGDLLDVVVMVPAGYSPTNYQPTPKEITALSDADLYFSIGVATEAANILPKAEEFNEDLEIIDLWSAVSDVYPARYFSEDEIYEEDEDHEDENHEDEDHEDHDHEGVDPHIWMSPKRVILMVEIIRDTLIESYPDYKETFTENAQNYIQLLTELDSSIKTSLADNAGANFIIYHPSMGYFAEDYDLTMIAIETDGKEASAQQIKDVIDLANDENVRVIFYQEEFDSSQAETIAKEIDGTTVKIAPLSGDYINNMNQILKAFEEVFNQ